MSAFWTPRAMSPDLGPMGAIRVFRLTDTGYQPMPHVQALSASFREGPNPGMGQCAIRFDQRLTALLGAPSRFELVWGVNAPSPWAVRPDDRLVFVRDEPNGTARIVFDGFAATSQLDLSAGQERVTFTVAGTPVREWDKPLPGARWRDARVNPADGGAIVTGDDHPGVWQEPGLINLSDKWTDLPARFNPDGLGNQTRTALTEEEAEAPEDHVKLSGDPVHMTYPVFRDTGSRKPGTASPDTAEMWSIATAARYVIGIGNPVDTWTSTYALTAPSVTGQPGRLLIDDLLSAWVPKHPEGSIWLLEPDGWERVSVPCQDIDVTGKAWPEALADILAPHGFTFAWRLGQKPDPDGVIEWDVPNWELDIYPVAYPPITRTVALQPAGSALDPSRSNLASATLALDTSGTIPRWRVDTDPARFEVTVCLTPAFEPIESDATPDGRKAFVGTAESGDPKYRDFILGEGGDPYWWFDKDATPPTNPWGQFQTPPALWHVFRPERGSCPETVEGDADDERRYARRRRPARSTLVTRDTKTDQPMNARVRVIEASKYTGEVPGLFEPEKLDAAVVPQEITQGAWELMPDRCGIRITAVDPNDWRIGEPAAADRAKVAFPKGVINVIQSLANPGDDGSKATKRFVLLLTCVIDGDRGLDALAEERPASPRAYPVERRDDARDRYRREIRTWWSEHYDKELPEGEEPPPESDRWKEYDEGRNDTERATAHAQSRRQGNEAARLAGSLTIRRLATAYRLGEAIGRIDGRGVSLDTMAGQSMREEPRFPVVVGIDYAFGSEVSTTLQLEDRRVEPVRIGREGGFRRA
jgi:hypothetical protein